MRRSHGGVLPASRFVAADSAPSYGCARQEGVALVVVLGAILVVSAMGLALVLLAISHTLAANNDRRAGAALYAAEASLERVIPDLLRTQDWDAVLDGRVQSGFTDGAPTGVRRLADGRSINLDEIVSVANCGVAGGCSDAQMNALTSERPWGPNNPRWRLFAYGSLSSVLSAAGVLPPSEYVVVLVADDPLEVDGDPLRDGRPGASRGAGVLQLRAEAFGPESAHRAVEITVSRGVPSAAAGGYQGQRGEGAIAEAGGEVQLPGEGLTRSEMTLSGGLTKQ